MCLVPLLVFYAVCLTLSGSEALYTAVNGSAPIYLFFVLLLPLRGLLRRVPESIWAPAAWLPISFAVFYGFGPLVAVYGNDATLWYMASTRLAASQAELFRANVLSALGIACLVGGWWASERWRIHRLGHGPISVYSYLSIKPTHLALVFIVIGGVLRHGILKPAEWAVASATIPGVISTLGPLVDVGFGLLAFSMITMKRRDLRIFFWMVWPSHLFLCALSLSKTELITAMLLPVLGAFLAHHNRRRLAVGMAIMAVVFALSQPWVQFGRGVIEAQTGTIHQAGYTDRINLLARYVTGERIAGAAQDDELQGWWTRMNYSGVQAYAMHAYDSGQRGSTLSNAWMHFIPRFIWPEKPVMEGPGAAFHSFVTGGEGTSFLALSVFGDLYWQFGWLGVILVCPLIGGFFANLSRRSIAIMQARQFIMLPVVLLALNTALHGMNKYLINGIVAVIPMYYGYLLALKLATRFLGSSKLRRPSYSYQPRSGDPE